MDIYERLKAAGIPLDNHESDLYAKVTPGSTAIVEEYQREQRATQIGPTVSVFKSNTDGGFWYDIPFAYTPWWENRK